jgi:hypothetical protein
MFSVERFRYGSQEMKEGLAKFRMEALSGGIFARDLNGLGISHEHHWHITG